MLNMKKSVISVIAALVSFTASAQMLPDSTVQVCAYWHKGDKVTYRCTSKASKVGADGIENITRTTSEKRIFEVTGETKKSYSLAVSYKDTEVSYAQGAMAELLNNINEQFVIKLKTDEFGTVQEITNRKETVANMSRLVPLAVDMIYEKCGDKAMEMLGVSKGQLKDQLTQSMCNEQAVETACMKDVMPILTYHGARLGLNERYSAKEQRGGIMGSGYIEADMTFWVDRAETDSSFVVIRSVSTAGKEALASVACENAKNIVRTMVPPEQLQEAYKEIDRKFQKADMSMMINNVTIVHLDSGWTTYYKFERHTKFTDENGTTDSVDIEEMILDSCE